MGKVFPWWKLSVVGLRNIYKTLRLSYAFSIGRHWDVSSVFALFSFSLIFARPIVSNY